MADEEVAEEEAVSLRQGESETLISPVAEQPLAPPKYEVRPGLGEKFQSENVREIILQTMQAQLTGRQYRADQAAHWSKVIANAVRQKVQELDMKRSVKDMYIILQTMQAQLTGRQYRADQAARWSKVIANAVRQKVQKLVMKRYKIMAQSTIIEMKGAGVKCAQRCIWDPETDSYVDDIYKNDSIFCYTIVYGVYMY